MTKLRPGRYLDNLSDYSLLFIALLTITSGLVYYFYALNWSGIIISLILGLGAFIVLIKKGFKNLPPDKSIPEPKNKISDRPFHHYWLVGLYAVSYFFLIRELGGAQSDKALITPWAVIDQRFFWLYALSSLLLIGVLIRKKINSRLKIILLSAHYFIALAVAVIVYKIGYGFDPFIHAATMELIATQGLVLPKPPYYLGEYGVIVIIHKLTGLSIYFLNKILVPALTAIFLPPALYNFLNSQPRTDENNTADNSLFLTILFLLILTFSPFIVTTPQNFSYLFLILTLLAGFSRYSLKVVYILAIATAAVHPLAGLPALGWAVWLSYKKYQSRLNRPKQKIIKIAIWLALALGLPLALWLTGGGNLKINSVWPLTFPWQNWWAGLGSAGREDWLSNFIYLLNNNQVLGIIILAGVGLFYFYHLDQRRGATNRETENKQSKEAASGTLFISSALLFAYYLSSQLQFANLINYEQDDYAGRLPIIILIFFLPFIIILLHRLITKVLLENRLTRTIWLAGGLGILCASLYLSYPRFDKYWNSRGYSTGANDIAAVKSIEQAANQPYIALANQPVSAAALQTFGFNHYYNRPAGSIYFYPIPTGGPLYAYYLKMVYGSPDRTIIKKAMDLAGVKLGYLVVNKYWYQSGRVISEAKLTAQRWWTVNNDVYIFEYRY